MKSILLTSTALVMVAGAAAADVALSGTAEAIYNDMDGYSTNVDAALTLTQELDNGMTASASMDLEVGGISFGDITLAGENASVTFGTGLNGAAFSAVSDTIGVGDGDEGVVTGVAGMFTVSGATVYLSIPDTFDADDLEIGVSTDMGGWTVGAGIAGSDFVAKASGNAGGADIAVAFGSVADVNRWDLAVSYPVGATTVSFDTDNSEAWTVGVAYAADGISAGIDYNSDETYEITAGYAMGDVAVNAGFKDTGDFKVNVGYTMDSLYVEGGMLYTDEAYVYAKYDLGGGAAIEASYLDGAADILEATSGDVDLEAGTTVKLAFTF
jgi:hypothetical protein